MQLAFTVAVVLLLAAAVTVIVRGWDELT